MNSVTVGQLIRKLRNEKQLSMIELAAQIGISQPSISRIENGTIELTLSQFEKVCHIFDLTPVQFFGLLNHEVDTNLNEFINEKKNITDELHQLIDQLSIEQQKGLYVFLQPFKK